MIVMRQRGRKQVRHSAVRGDKLGRIQNSAISNAEWLVLFANIAAWLTFLIFAGGLVVWLAGIAAQGWIVSISSAAPGLLSVLFFSREKAANDRVDTVRKHLEEQEAEKRKKRDQELEDKKKKQKEEEYVLYMMRKLEAYYKLASKTDVEDQREIYYHELFGPAEYNKRRIEVYFNTMSQIEGENAKKAFFLENFSSLLKQERLP